MDEREPEPTAAVRVEPVVEPPCASSHCDGVRCRRPRGHTGVHEFERPDGSVFYWA